MISASVTCSCNGMGAFVQAAHFCCRHASVPSAGEVTTKDSHLKAVALFLLLPLPQATHSSSSSSQEKISSLYPFIDKHQPDPCCKLKKKHWDDQATLIFVYLIT